MLQPRSIMSTGVIGLGNPLRRDDGVVMVLFDRLRSQGLPQGVELVDLGDGGFRMFHVLDDFERVVVVDAVQFGGDPGDSTVFTPEEVRSTREHRSSHDTNLLELLDMAAEFGIRPDPLVIFAIQPRDVSMGEELSPALRDRVPFLTADLEETIKELRV